jgi:hypothetical protein
VVAGHRLHQRPPHHFGALLGDRTAHGLCVPLPVSGREPGPRAQGLGGTEPTDVAELGHQDGGDGGADPVDRLDRQVAPVAPQLGLDLLLEHRHLPVIELDQTPQRRAARGDPFRSGTTGRPRLHRLSEITRASPGGRDPPPEAHIAADLAPRLSVPTICQARAARSGQRVCEVSRRGVPVGHGSGGYASRV